MQLIPSIILKHFEGRKVLKSIIANSGWLFVDRIFRMGVGLFVGVWVARYLGVEQFGLFNYAMAYVALFSNLATLGLPSLVIRLITNEPEKREEILGTTFWLQLAGGIASLLIAVSMMYVLRSNDGLTLRLVAILAATSIFKAFGAIELWFQSQVQSKYLVLAGNTAFLIIIIVKIILINLQAPLLAFAAATLAEAAIVAVGLIFFHKLQGYSLWAWRWSLPLARTLLSESWPLILSGFAIMFYLKVDQIMLGEMLGNQVVGLYSTASRFSEIWYFIPTAIASSAAPSIYAAKKENESLYYQRIGKLLKVLSLIAIVIAVSMTFLSGEIITRLYGHDYAAAAPILAIHIWAGLFVFVGVGSSSWFIAEGLAHLTFIRTLLGAIINVGLNILLIPVFGGIGAAISTVISYAIGSVLVNSMNPRTQKIFILQIRSIALQKTV